jgi:hypothetical protein
MGTVSYSDLYQACDDDIRAGRARAVQSRFAEIALPRVPREWRLKLATICRRADLISHGLKLLQPIVRDHGTREYAEPTSAELAEYGVLLQKAGAVEEALRILGRVDPLKNPETFLFQAFCHFNRWDYETSVPLLHSYLKSDLSPYAHLVGRVNLASANLATARYPEAESLLGDILTEAEAGGHLRLRANCLEMRAQLRLIGSDFTRANEDLELASKLFGAEKTQDDFMVAKWQAILAALSSRDLTKLSLIRETATSRRDWESVREVDLYGLKAEFSAERADYLYFGTPYLAYRARIERELQWSPQENLYTLGKSGVRTLAMASGDVLDDQANITGMRAEGATHRMLAQLFCDFYRPASLGTLFAALYPGEYYDPFSSPGRVHQVLRRTRKWLRESALPIEVSEDRDGYRAHILAPDLFSVQIQKVSVAPGRFEAMVERLRLQFGSGEFTAQEASQALQISRVSFRRLTTWALKSGKLEKFGAARNTSYLLAQNTARAAA